MKYCVLLVWNKNFSNKNVGLMPFIQNLLIKRKNCLLRLSCFIDVKSSRTFLCSFFSISHCVKSVHIRCFSCPYFLTFGLDIERYFVSRRIRFECGKMRTRKILNTYTFHAVSSMVIFSRYI